MLGDANEMPLFGEGPINTRTNAHRDWVILGEIEDRYGDLLRVELVPHIGEQGDDYGDWITVDIMSDGEWIKQLHFPQSKAKALRELFDMAEAQAAIDSRRM